MRVVDAVAVDEQQDPPVVVAGAREAAHAGVGVVAVVGDEEAAHAAQHVGERAPAVAQDLGARDDADVRGRFGQRLVVLGRREHGRHSFQQRALIGDRRAGAGCATAPDVHEPGQHDGQCRSARFARRSTSG